MQEIINNLQNGNLVSFPTDTIYALACDAQNKSAIDKIYKIKKRDILKPLSVFFKNIEQAREYLIFNKSAEILAKNFIPGELTLILKKKNNKLDYVNQNKDNNTIGFRIPNSKLCLKILENISPIVATSVNISGEEPALTSNEIKKKFADQINLIIDNEEEFSAKASTVIDLSKDEPLYIREGNIPFSLIKKILEEQQ